MRFNTPPVLAQPEYREIWMDEIHPSKPHCKREQAVGNSIVCCHVLPDSPYQICGGISQTPWPGFTPCSTTAVTQTLLTTPEEKSFKECKRALVLHIFLIHRLPLPESKTANHPELSISKFSQASDIPGLTSPVHTGFTPSHLSGVTPALPLHHRRESQIPL